jgi:hypothetical protein
MTCTELAQLITRRVFARAQEEPDPEAYVVRAFARVMELQQHCPIEHMESALLEFGRDFGLLVQGIEKEERVPQVPPGH